MRVAGSAKSVRVAATLACAAVLLQCSGDGAPKLSRTPPAPTTPPSGAAADRLAGIAAPIAAEPGGASRFALRDGAVGAFFTDDGLSLALPGQGVKVTVGGAARVAPAGEDAAPARVHRLVGPRGSWATDLPTYRRVRYSGLRPGVDLTFESRPRAVEYALHLAPGTDPAHVHLRWEGVEAVRRSRDGKSLEIVAGPGILNETGLLAYQEQDGSRRALPVRYAPPRQSADGKSWEVGFEVEGVEPRLPLVIDPAISWAGLLGGGAGGDLAYGMALDWGTPANVFVVGTTQSANFPHGSGLDPGLNGTSDAFVSKFDSAGALVWSTYLGGNGTEDGLAIVVNGAGEAIVAGRTDSPDFPAKSGLGRPHMGSDDGFVAKLSAAGDSLVWASFVGGSAIDKINALALDGGGNVYFAGETTSANLPTANAADATYGGAQDAFAGRLSSTGAAIDWLTYLGGSSTESATGLVWNSPGGQGNDYVVVVGWSASSDFPLVNAFDTTTQATDGFALRIPAAGGALAWSTFLGGTGQDRANAVTTEPTGTGNFFVVGETWSSNLPAVFASRVVAPYDDTLGGATDGLVVEITPSGALQWWSYLGGAAGGSGLDEALAVACDAFGNVYVAGATGATDFYAPGYQKTKNGGYDAFALRIEKATRTVSRGTYFGGSATSLADRTGEDTGYGLAVDLAGNVYLAGSTFSDTLFPLANAQDSTIGGRSDAFVARLNSTLTSVSWSTYLGGDGPLPSQALAAAQRGTGLAVDGSGNAYVVGYTYAGGFPVTTGSLDTALGGNQDAFVTKVAADGKSILWSTFLGGTNNDSATAVHLDSAGNVIVVGSTASNNFPTTAGAFQTSLRLSDGFVTKLAPGGSALVWSTYLGGASSDAVNAVDVDASDAVYVTGLTYSDSTPAASSFPTTAGAFDVSYNSPGYRDAFVTKIRADGTGLVWSTYLGGSLDDTGHAIVVDGTGNVVVAGTSNSDGGPFPISTGFPAKRQYSYYDAFVTRFDTAGAFVWSRLLDDTVVWGYQGGDDAAKGLAFDPSGNIVVVGKAGSFYFTVAGGWDTTKNGLADAFVVKLTSAGANVWGTFLGGADDDEAAAVAVNAAGDVFVTGMTASPTFPTQTAIDPWFNGGTDAFLAKLSPAGALSFSTYLGGTADDSGQALALSGTDVYLAGYTQSPLFPGVLPISFSSGALHPYNAAWDLAFVAKLSMTAPNPAVKLGFSPATVAVQAGACSSPIELIAQDQANGEIAVTSQVSVDLSTGSTTMSFYAAADSTCATPLNPKTVRLLAGESRVSFRVRETRANSWWITRSTTSDLSVGAPIPVEVSPAPAAALVFTQQPAGAVAGNTLSTIKVTARDTYGNDATAFSGNVTLEIDAGPQTTFSAGTATVAAVGGVATFSDLVLQKAGTYTLRASSGTLATASSTSFDIAAAPAFKMAFLTHPDAVVAGADMDFQVVATDTYGNRVPWTTTVALSIASGPQTAFSWGQTEAAPSGGVAWFGYLQLYTAGTYVVRATSGSLQPGDTAEISVTHGNGTVFRFTTQPQNGLAGQTLASIVLRVEDWLGNPVTNWSGDATLFFSPSPGNGAVLSGSTTVATSAGVATFSSVSVDLVGTYTLRAQTGALTSPESSSFAIAAGPATQLAFTPQPQDGTAGVALPGFSLTVKDAKGNVVTGHATAVGIAIASGPQGTFTSGPTSVMPTNGVAVFTNLFLEAAGSYTLTATSDTLTATSSSFNVSPNAASATLEYTQPPQGTTAGQAMADVQVRVRDPYGNTVTAWGPNVSLSIASGPQGSFSAGAASLPPVNGVATFSGLALNAAGTYTLRAASGGLPTKDSASFDVSAGPAHHLAFSQQPQGATVDDLLPAIAVAIQDSLGNPVPSYASSITLAIESGPLSAFSAGTATRAPSGGVATFGDLRLNKAGTYALRASSGTFSDVVSSSFAMTHGAATQLVFTQQPTTGTAGVPVSSFQVEVRDAFGNVATGYATAVTLGIQSAPAGADTSFSTSQTPTLGVATFSGLTPTVAGGYVLRATSGTLAADSQTVTIDPGPVDHLAFTQGPAGGTAGEPLADVKVTAQDEFGNPVTGFSGTVSLGLASGPQAAFDAGNTSAAPASGVATFSGLVLKKAGSYLARASASGVADRDSSAFAIGPTAAASLAFSAPPQGALAGESLADVVVEVKDAFGNRATGYSGSVSLSIASGPQPSFSTGSVSATVVAGLATFSALSMQAAGSYVLRAGSGALPTVDAASITISPAAAAKLVFTEPPQSGTAGLALADVKVGAQDTYGNPVTTYAATMALAIDSGPQGAFSGGATSVTPAGGVGTFSGLVLQTAGQYVLRATSGALTPVTSALVSIAAGAATQLVFVQQPQASVSGQAIPDFAVEAKDAYGNLDPAFVSSVSMAVHSGPQSGFTSGITTRSAVTGRAPFTGLVLSQAGTYVLRATSGALTVDSASFAVSAGAPAAIVFTAQPAGGIAGAAPGSASVELRDAAGNTATGFSGTVTLSISSGPQPSFSTGASSVSAVQGVAIFSGLTVNKTGTYVLRAQASGLWVDSESFVVAHAGASLLVFTQQPQPGSAGQTLAPVVVTVTDSLGNAAADYTSAVVLSVASGPLTGFSAGTTTQAAAGGVATFVGLRLDLEGTYTLSATSGALTGTSDAFTLQPGPADAGTAGPDAGSSDAAQAGADAAQAGADAAQAGADAAQAGADAGAAGADAATPEADAAAPGSDAAAPGSDASAQSPDASPENPDASTPGADAGTPEPDAAAPDGGAVVADASAQVPDAGGKVPGADASSAGPDTGFTVQETGCGCSAGASEPVFAALLGLLAVVRRRRRGEAGR